MHRSVLALLFASVLLLGGCAAGQVAQRHGRGDLQHDVGGGAGRFLAGVDGGRKLRVAEQIHHAVVADAVAAAKFPVGVVIGHAPAKTAGHALLSNGISTTDIGLRDNYREFYMNFVSLSGGETWRATTVVGTFQLKVIGTAGSSVIRNSANQVSTKDGQDSYAATAQDVTVIVSDGCRIRFETNGGSEVPDQSVALGGKIKRPDDPTKEGFYLEGWYSDMDLQHKWDFAKDAVSGNMTLYAKWTTEAPAPHFSLWWLIILILLLIVILLILWGRKNGYRRVSSAANNRKGGTGDIPASDIKKEERDE